MRMCSQGWGCRSRPLHRMQSWTSLPPSTTYHCWRLATLTEFTGPSKGRMSARLWNPKEGWCPWRSATHLESEMNHHLQKSSRNGRKGHPSLGACDGDSHVGRWWLHSASGRTLNWHSTAVHVPLAPTAHWPWDTRGLAPRELRVWGLQLGSSYLSVKQKNNPQPPSQCVLLLSSNSPLPCHSTAYPSIGHFV